MDSIAQFPVDRKNRIRFVLTDIDDTLTTGGQLPSCSLSAMERLQDAGIRVLPITGRPAGWCDHMVRMWPIDGIVGENGAFYFRYERENKRVVRRYWKTATQRHADRLALDRIRETVLETVPGCAVASDQAYREADLAIDFCEDVDPLPADAVQAIVRCFTKAGATAKISSIHVNGWFGDYNKLSMTRRFFKEVYRLDLQTLRDTLLFVGDSPNDAPMFRYFKHTVGVANILDISESMEYVPKWITKEKGGQGFAEMVNILLS